MPFDLDNLNPATRFFWPGSDNQEWVELRVTSDADLLEFRKRLGIRTKVEYPVNPQTRAINRVEATNLDDEKTQALSDEITDFCIADWSLLAKDGTAIACTRENKLRLVRGHPPFSKWIEDCLKQLRSELGVRAEEETKN